MNVLLVQPIAASYSRGAQVRTLDELRVMDSFRGWVARNLIDEEELLALIHRIRTCP